MSEQPHPGPAEAEPTDQEFEHTKSWYFATLAAHINPAMQLHAEQGLLEKDAEGERQWGNVTEHCLVEAARAREFAELLRFDTALSEDLLLAAGVHDFFKRGEAEFADQHGLSLEGFAETTRHSTELMRQAGLSDRVVRLATAVGHEAIPDTQALLAQPTLSDEDIAYLVLHLIDDYTSGSAWVAAGSDPIERRIGVNQQNPRYHALDEAGRALFGGKTTYEMQLEIGHAVEQRLSQIITERTGTQLAATELPLAIDGKIRQRISALVKPA